MSAVVDANLNPAAPPSVEADAAPEADTGAAVRLEASRARLREAMLPAAPRPAAASRPAVPAFRRAASGLLSRVESLPGATLARETVVRWWERHPMSGVALIATEASKVYLTPIARRNPLKFVFASALVGAVLIVLRPWRLIARSALTAGVLSQVLRMSLKHLPLATLGLLVRSRGGRSVVRKSATTAGAPPAVAAAAAVPPATGVKSPR